MKNIVKDIINEIYVNKNYDLFRKRCKNSISKIRDYVDELSKNYKVTLSDFDDSDPCDIITIEYGSYTCGDFSVEYRTIIKVCKIVKIFYMQHEFSVNNVDPSSLQPTLDGYGGMAYTKQQYELEENVVKFFDDMLYQKIELCELDEVICDIQQQDKSIFGTQLTVENALFRDILCLTENIQTGELK